MLQSHLLVQCLVSKKTLGYKVQVRPSYNTLVYQKVEGKKNTINKSRFGQRARLPAPIRRN